MHLIQQYKITLIQRLFFNTIAWNEFQDMQTNCRIAQITVITNSSEHVIVLIIRLLRNKVCLRK